MKRKHKDIKNKTKNTKKAKRVKADKKIAKDYTRTIKFVEQNTETRHKFMSISIEYSNILKAEGMVTPRRKCRRPAMVTPKSYPYP